MKPSYLIFLLLANLSWGCVYSAYIVLGQHLSPGGIVTLRFTLAALCFLPLWPFLRGPAPRGRHLFNACLMGVLHFVLGQRLQVWATQLGTASNSAVLMALEPLLTSVAATIFLREHLGPRRLAGFAQSVFGVAIAALWLGEAIHWGHLFGTLAIAAGLVLGLSRQMRRPATAEAAQ